MTAKELRENEYKFIKRINGENIENQGDKMCKEGRGQKIGQDIYNCMMV